MLIRKNHFQTFQLFNLSTFFLTLLLSSLLTPLFPCECPPLPDLDKNERKKYDLVFTGTVDSIAACDGQSAVYFSIEELYVGRATTTKQIKIYFDCSTSCEMMFAKAEKWLIYAKYSKYAHPEVEFCSRSRKYFTDATKDYYIVSSKLTFEDEIEFLRKNVGVIDLQNENNSTVQLQRELIKPKGTAPLFLLIFSLVSIGVIYFLLKKFLK